MGSTGSNVIQNPRQSQSQATTQHVRRSGEVVRTYHTTPQRSQTDMYNIFKPPPRPSPPHPPPHRRGVPAPSGHPILPSPPGQAPHHSHTRTYANISMSSPFPPLPHAGARGTTRWRPVRCGVAQCAGAEGARGPCSAHPLCDISSGCGFFTGPWTVTHSSLRMLRRVAAFCRPLRPMLPLVLFPRERGPVVGVPGLCWRLRGPFDGCCCPLPSAFRSSPTCLAAFPWARGPIAPLCNIPSGCCSLRGPGQSPVRPFACCVGSLLSVGRCGRCSCWCRFGVRGAQWLACWDCAECGMVCRLRVSGAQ